MQSHHSHYEGLFSPVTIREHPWVALASGMEVCRNVSHRYEKRRRVVQDDIFRWCRIPRWISRSPTRLSVCQLQTKKREQTENDWVPGRTKQVKDWETINRDCRSLWPQIHLAIGMFKRNLQLWHSSGDSWNRTTLSVATVIATMLEAGSTC